MTSHPPRSQAHRVGHVTAMVRTPQGELWTGSSRGYIRWGWGCRQGRSWCLGLFNRITTLRVCSASRCFVGCSRRVGCLTNSAPMTPPLQPCRVWELGEPALVGEAPAPPRCRELRKGYGERPHSGAVLALACPADGQVVWSASQKGLLLWDAACGAFLGALQRGPARSSGGGGANSPDLVPASGAADNSALRYKVDPSKVGSQGLCEARGTVWCGRQRLLWLGERQMDASLAKQLRTAVSSAVWH